MRSGHWMRLFLFVCTCLPLSAFAQERPLGYFTSDSIRLGKPVVYSLSFRHDPAMVVVFPDTNYKFTPFELVSKKFYPTRTDAKGSLDSVIYTLVSFEIDSVQQFSLPVYVVSEKDSTALFAEPDSVRFQAMISGPVDSLSLRTNTRYIPISPPANYAYALLILVGLAVLFGLFVLIFGKQIRKRFRLYRLQRRHLAFMQHFTQAHGTAVGPDTISVMEKVVILWKKYIETLGNKPYSTYTTKEISDSIAEKPLVEALRHIDRTVYGGLPFDPSTRPFQALEDFAIRLYEKRRKEIIAG